MKRESVVSSEPVAGSGSGFAGVGFTAVPGGASRVRSAWCVRGGPKGPARGLRGQARRPRQMGGRRRRIWPRARWQQAPARPPHPRTHLKVIGDFRKALGQLQQPLWRLERLLAHTQRHRRAAVARQGGK